MVDDILDNSEQRRGLLCWHRKPSVGVSATLDVHMAEQGAYILLNKYFSNHHSFIPNFQIISNMVYRMYLGIYVDVYMRTSGKPCLEHFTMQNYLEIITKYKAKYYGVYFPMSLGMHMANCYDPDMHEEVKLIFRGLDSMLIVEVIRREIYLDKPNFKISE